MQLVLRLATSFQLHRVLSGLKHLPGLASGGYVTKYVTNSSSSVDIRSNHDYIRRRHLTPQFIANNGSGNVSQEDAFSRETKQRPVVATVKCCEVRCRWLADCPSARVSAPYLELKRGSESSSDEGIRTTNRTLPVGRREFPDLSPFHCRILSEKSGRPATPSIRTLFRQNFRSATEHLQAKS